MNSKNEFFGKVKDIVDKGMDVSKDFLTKAGGKVQDFSEKGVLKVEIMQLERQLDKIYARIGQSAADSFEANPDCVLAAGDEPFASALQQIASLKEQLAKKQAAENSAAEDADSDGNDGGE